MTYSTVDERDLVLREAYRKWRRDCPRQAVPSHGHLYVIESLDGSGLSKIGVSTNIHGRFRRIRTECNGLARLVIVIQSTDVWALEEWMGIHFRTQRVRGEWFRFSMADLNWIGQRVSEEGQDG